MPAQCKICGYEPDTNEPRYQGHDCHAPEPASVLYKTVDEAVTESITEIKAFTDHAMSDEQYKYIGICIAHAYNLGAMAKLAEIYK